MFPAAYSLSIPRSVIGRAPGEPGRDRPARWPAPTTAARATGYGPAHPWAGGGAHRRLHPDGNRAAAARSAGTGRALCRWKNTVRKRIARSAQAPLFTSRPAAGTPGIVNVPSARDKIAGKVLRPHALAGHVGQGDVDEDTRAAVLSRVDLDSAADHLGPLAHVDHAQAATAIVVAVHRAHVEAHAIVLDLDHQDVALGLQPHPDVLGLGMLARVVDGLFHDVKQHALVVHLQPVVHARLGFHNHVLAVGLVHLFR